MSKYNTPENVCFALSVFITEIREYAAAMRAYDNTFQNKPCDNLFMQRSYDALWRELLSEIAKIFDSAGKDKNENCTLLRLKELCLNKQYAFWFPNGEDDTLVQLLDSLFKKYNQLPIKKSRRKQLAHHDLNQTIVGKCIAISLEEIEKLIIDITDVFVKIYMRFYLDCVDISFPDYNILVDRYEMDIKRLVE